MKANREYELSVRKAGRGPALLRGPGQTDLVEVVARLQAIGLDPVLARDVAKALPVNRRRGATLETIRETLELQLAPLAADDDTFAPIEVFIIADASGQTETG